MTIHVDRPDQGAEDDLAHQLQHDWRVRCAARRAAWELTSGQAATELCASVVRTLETGDVEPGLARSARAWGAHVASPREARAALQCLAEAVSALAATEFGEFRPRGLDPALEQLAWESLVPAGRRTLLPRVDAVSGCRDRASLEHDLAAAVASALSAGDDVTVAVLEAADDDRTAGDASSSGLEDARLLGLLATIRRVFGRRAAVYRVGDAALAVLAPRLGTMAVGELILRASLGSGPTFSWGTANLRSVGDQAVTSPDVLLLLAESDLILRRQDFSRVSRVVVRHRQFSVVGSIAAGMLLVAGVGLAVVRSPTPTPTPTTHEALPARVEPAPAPAGNAPAVTTVPTPSTPPPSPAPHGSSASPAGGRSVIVPPPTTNAVLTSFHAPTTTPGSAPTSPPPPPAGSPASTHGNSGKAPGHSRAGGPPGKGKGKA